MKKPSALKQLYELFTPNERKKALILFILSLLSAFSQAIGVFSIFPFINVLMNPDYITNNATYSYFYDLFNFSSTNYFMIALGFLIFMVMVGSNFLTALTLWFKTRFVFNRNHEMSKRLLEVYLGRDYEFFLTRNTSELAKNILAEVNQLTQNYLISLFEIVISGFVLVFIIIAIIIIDPVVTSIAIAFFGIVYLAINYFVKKGLISRGEKRFEANKERYRMAIEALSSIKTTKILGVENFYLYRYSNNSARFAKYNSYAAVAGQMPKYIIEAIAFGGLVFFMTLQLALGNDVNSLIPVVSVLALAGYRMLPAIQIVFLSASKIYYNRPILDKIYEDTFDFRYHTKVKMKDDSSKIELTNSIILQDVWFSYDSSESKKVLKSINLEIKRGESIGLIGTSGAGKTTLVDIIMGLLIPQSGHIKIDDTIINKSNVHAWQKHIGYVPQVIYLSDDTVANNIAFGIGDSSIDMSKVKKAAELAALDTFIQEELPNGYNTVVGERGIRLSGGQRQRIGLARALYNNPKVLILDEATSALDSNTETAVIEAIENASKNRTVIMIAHRVTTLKNCDYIYKINKGVIESKVIYSNL